MEKKVNYRLCGGTFFTLLLIAKKKGLGAKEHYKGESDDVSEPFTLMGLAKIVLPDYEEPEARMMKTVKSSTTDYKKCVDECGSYFPFSDQDALKTFDNRIKNDYGSVLNDMVSFCNRFLVIKDSTNKDKKLVRALIDLIIKDDSIPESQVFYANEDGTAVNKSNIKTMTQICFQSFLLGVFHFAVTRPESNKIGKDTFDAWCPSTGGGRRKYEGNMGETLDHNISLSYKYVVERVEPDIVEEGNSTEDFTETYSQHESESVPKNSPQMVFNFNVTGNNNSFYNHVDTVNNYHGGRKNGE